MSHGSEKCTHRAQFPFGISDRSQESEKTRRGGGAWPHVKNAKNQGFLAKHKEKQGVR